MRHAGAWLALVALILPSAAWAQSASEGAAFKPWAKAQLKIIETPGEPAANRSKARDAIIARAGPSASATSTQRIEMGRILTEPDMLPALLSAKDPIAALDAAVIAASVQHVYLVPLLQEALRHPQHAVRYWAAKGLVDVQAEMFKMSVKKYFEDPVAALSDQGVKEDNPAVAREIYRALAPGPAAASADPVKSALVYRTFMTVFRERVKRLDRRQLDGVMADVAGLASAAAWAEHYSRDRALRADVLFWESQLLRWATLLYEEHAAELGDQDRADLQLLIVKAAETLSAQVKDEKFGREVREQLAKPDFVRTRQAILHFAGDPSMPNTDYALKKHGVPPARPLTEIKQPAATQPQPPAADEPS